MNTNTQTQTIREENESLIHQYAIEHRIEFPVRLSNVLSLGGVLGYCLDGKYVSRLISNKQIVSPGAKNNSGQFLYTIHEILGILDVAEVERRWVAAHPRHVHKLTDAEFSAHKHELETLQESMLEWSLLPTTQLIRQIVNSESRKERMAIATLLIIRSGGGDDE